MRLLILGLLSGLGLAASAAPAKPKPPPKPAAPSKASAPESAAPAPAPTPAAAAAPAPAPSEAPAKGLPNPSSLAVLETNTNGLPDRLGALVSQAIGEYAANELRRQVVSKEDIRRLVTFEMQKQLLGCDSAACETVGSVGEALGVARIVTSRLTAVGDRLMLGVVVLDVRNQTAVGRATREVRAEAELPEAVRDAVHFALTQTERESKGYARIEGPAGAQVVVDGAALGVLPMLPVRLPKGRHVVQVEKPGFLPLESTIEILVGKEALLEAKLLPTSDVKVAGLALLPWASATAALAVVSGGLSGYFYVDARKAYQERYLVDPAGTGVPGPITRVELEKARDYVDFRGNTLAYYSAWTAGILGGVSVVLFSAYAVAGAGAGSGGDAVAVEPRPDGVVLSF
jgi:hypothetical protein